MQEITISGTYLEGGEKGNSPANYRNCLIQGFEKIGVKIAEVTPSLSSRTKYVATWGWQRGKALRDQGHEVLVLERGYIGDRFKYTSLGWNGLNNYANFPDYPEDKGERFKSHGGILKPWMGYGKYILILGQVQNDASLKGKNINLWYEQVAAEAERIHKLPVYFRPHPEAKRRGGYNSVEGIKNLPGSLEDALNDALFTIAYNSNSCLDSILAGIPCFAGDKGTMAWNLCMPSLEKIETPYREPLVHKIAWNQWSSSEIRSGEALKAFLK